MIDFAEWLGATPFSVAIQSRLWITPLLQSLHILMIGVVFTSILVMALRVLGRMRTDEAPADIWRRFAPWFWRALVVMAATGLVLTIAEPVREFTAFSFWFKMTLLVIGLSSAAYFGRTLSVATGTAEFSGKARVVAVVTVALWLTIIFLGRAIAYDVEVWGSWHLA